MRKIHARREVLRATPARHAPSAAAIAADRQCLARLRRDGRDRNRSDLRAINAERGKIPIFVRLNDLGRRLEAVRKLNGDLPGGIAHDVPVAHDQTKIATHVNERAATVRNAVFFGNDDPSYRGKRRGASGQLSVASCRLPVASTWRLRAGKNIRSRLLLRA